MSAGLVLSIIAGVVPMLGYAVFVYWLDRFEKEPKTLLAGIFAWGAVVAAGLAFTVNTLMGTGVYHLTGSREATLLTTGSLIAPIVEESLKGCGVLVIALFFRDMFDSLLDGIVYAGVVALGFAATENAYYIYHFGYLPGGLHGILSMSFVRDILVGWQHPFFTAFIGIGLGVARLSRSGWIRWLAPSIGWMAAVATHSLHNSISDLLSDSGPAAFSTALDWLGWTFMLAFILVSLVREQRWVSCMLCDEVSMGILTPEQQQVASSALGQMRVRLAALSAGSFYQTNRFYQLCGVLAHKKRLREILGEHEASSLRISNIRTELVSLAPQVATL